MICSMPHLLNAFIPYTIDTSVKINVFYSQNILKFSERKDDSEMFNHFLLELELTN